MLCLLELAFLAHGVLQLDQLCLELLHLLLGQCKVLLVLCQPLLVHVDQSVMRTRSKRKWHQVEGKKGKKRDCGENTTKDTAQHALVLLGLQLVLGSLKLGVVGLNGGLLGKRLLGRVHVAADLGLLDAEEDEGGCEENTGYNTHILI